MLICELGEQLVAVRSSDIDAILPLPRLWRPPSLPRPIMGFFNLGGEAVAALSLKRLLGREEDAALNYYAHLLLLYPRDGVRHALLVDRAADFFEPADSVLMPVKDADSFNGCIAAEVSMDGQIVHVLSTERLLLSAETERVKHLTEMAQQRMNEWAEPA